MPNGHDLEYKLAMAESMKKIQDELAEAKRRLSQITHCDNCGGSWVDDGINKGCYCRKGILPRCTHVEIHKRGKDGAIFRVCQKCGEVLKEKKGP